MKTRLLFACVCVIALAGCSFENKYESEADRITRAVMADDITPVKADLAPGLNISRVQLAAASDELDAQGKLLSVKEITPCDRVGYHCFDVKFEKHDYREWLAMDDTGKVTVWHFHMAQ